MTEKGIITAALDKEEFMRLWNQSKNPSPNDCKQALVFLNDYLSIVEKEETSSPQPVFVIFGQDPYPNLRHACGRSFLVRGEVDRPVSLEVLYKLAFSIGAFYFCKFIDKYPTRDSDNVGDKERLLALNTHLTAPANTKDETLKNNVIHSHWAPFTEKVYITMFSRLCENPNVSDIHILLAGVYAQEMWKTLVNKLALVLDPQIIATRICVYESQHPSMIARLGGLRIGSLSPQIISTNFGACIWLHKFSTFLSSFSEEDID